MKAIKTTKSTSISSVVIKFTAADAFALNELSNHVNAILGNDNAKLLNEEAKGVIEVPVRKRPELSHEAAKKLSMLLFNIIKHFEDFSQTNCFDPNN